MARGRIISATLGESRKYKRLCIVSPSLGEFAQALFPLIIANTDDWGLIEGDAETIKLKVFPGSMRSEADFEAALQLLGEVGLVQRYEATGEIYLQVLKFEEHQSGLNRRTRPKFPLPAKIDRNFQKIPVEEEEEVESEGEDEATPIGVGASRGKPRSARTTLCDDEYLSELQTREAYHDLNVRYVYSKMVSWCEVKHKQPTRARLVNWLNREDLPMRGVIAGGKNGQNYQQRPSYSQRQSAGIRNALTVVGLGPRAANNPDADREQRSLPPAGPRRRGTGGDES